MIRSRRALLALAIASTSLVACDSLPGAFEPEGADWPAELRVTNTGSRRITAVEAQCTALTRVNRRTLNVGPGQTWIGKYPEGDCFISFEFNTGGGWTAGVTFSASTPVQLSPW